MQHGLDNNGTLAWTCPDCRTHFNLEGGCNEVAIIQLSPPSGKVTRADAMRATATATPLPGGSDKYPDGSIGRMVCASCAEAPRYAGLPRTWS